MVRASLSTPARHWWCRSTTRFNHSTIIHSFRLTGMTLLHLDFGIVDFTVVPLNQRWQSLAFAIFPGDFLE
jgi:hypothetical protein